MSTAPPKETETEAAPWYAAYPEPQSDLMNISRAEVLEMLKGSTGETAGKDFVLVDLRRDDCKVRSFVVMAGVHPPRAPFQSPAPEPPGANAKPPPPPFLPIGRHNPRLNQPPRAVDVPDPPDDL